VPRGESGRLVEEEELGEPARLEERVTVPIAELQSAGDPPFPGIAAADPPRVVVEAAPVPVDEAARAIGDQLTERSDPVLERHRDRC